MVAKDKLLAEGGLFGMAFQLSDAHRFPPGSQLYRMDSSDSENDYVEIHHIKRPTHNHWTNRSRGFCDSMGLPLPQLTPFPALPQQKLSIHHSQ